MTTTQDIGGIYSDERCSICNSPFVDDGVGSLSCKQHLSEKAKTFKARLRTLTYRTDTYLAAQDRLSTWRDEIRDGVFDLRLHKRGTVLTIGHILDSFMDLVKLPRLQKGRITVRTFNGYRTRLMRFVNHVGPQCLITDVDYRCITMWLAKDTGSPKTVHETYRLLKEMLTWAYNMGDLPEMPRFPDYDFNPNEDMKLRKVVNKETQENILDAVRKHSAPRVYLGCRFLATYINVRPGELLNVKEKDYNREKGLLTIRVHKGSRTIPKVVALLEEDNQLLASLPTGFPEMPLFRHDNVGKGVRPGDGLGKSAFYRAWKNGCKHVGVRGVDLYGGTRHSSAIALYEDAGVTPEQIKSATGHATSQSFMRYFRIGVEGVREIHGLTRRNNYDKLGFSR